MIASGVMIHSQGIHSKVVSLIIYKYMYNLEDVTNSLFNVDYNILCMNQRTTKSIQYVQKLIIIMS